MLKAAFSWRDDSISTMGLDNREALRFAAE
jgi:hypothetical protein